MDRKGSKEGLGSKYNLNNNSVYLIYLLQYLKVLSSLWWDKEKNVFLLQKFFSIIILVQKFIRGAAWEIFTQKISLKWISLPKL